MSLEELDQFITTQKAQHADREKLRDSLKDAETAVNEKTLVDNTNNTLTQLTTDFDFIIAMDAALPAARQVGLNLAALQTQDFEDLMRLVNQAHTRGLRLHPPIDDVGWSESHNTDHALRMRLAHAMIEARARQIDPTVATITPPMSDVIARLNEHQLRTGTVESVARDINRVGGVAVFGPAAAAFLGGGDLDPNIPLHRTIITTIITQANNHLDARRQAMIQTITGNENRLRNISDLINTQTSNIDTLRTHYEVTKTLLNSRETLLIESQRINDEIERFTDTTLVTTQAVRQEFTQPEHRLAGFTVGMSEIYDLIFQYKSKPNRAEFFKQIIKVLPPQLLMQELNAGLNLGLPPLAINNFLTALGTEFELGNVDDIGLRRSFREMIYNLSRRVLAY